MQQNAQLGICKPSGVTDCRSLQFTTEEKGTFLYAHRYTVDYWARCTVTSHIFVLDAARRLPPIPEETAASEASSLPWIDLLAHTPAERWPWKDSTSDPLTPPTPRISKGVPPSPTHLRFERGLQNGEKFFQIQNGRDEYIMERERRSEAEKSKNEAGVKCRIFPGGSGDIPMRRLQEENQDQEESPSPVVESLTRHLTTPLGSLSTFEVSTSATAATSELPGQSNHLLSGRVLVEEDVPAITKLQHFPPGIEIPKQKRGRGRPPKKTEKKITQETTITVPTPSSASSSENLSNPNQNLQHGRGPRPRGRPRKEFESKNSMKEKYKRALEVCAVKRGRGRPRKVTMDGEGHGYQIVGTRTRQSPRGVAGNPCPKYPKRSKSAFLGSDGSSMDGPSASTSASAGQIRQECGQDFRIKIVTLQDVIEVLGRFPVHLSSIPKPKRNALNKRAADACKGPAGRPRKELGLKLLKKGTRASSFSNQSQNFLSAVKRSRGRPRKQNPGEKDPKGKIERVSSHLSENPY